jgi:hypothetical protein
LANDEYLRRDQVSNEYIVFAFFDNESAACKAADSLEDWDKSREDIKLGACGVFVAEDGKIKKHVGRWGGPGAWVGAIIGVVEAVFTGGVGIVSDGMAGGVTVGGVGSFIRRANHLTERDFEIIVEALHKGKGVLLAACNPDELVDTAEELKALGGEVSAWELPEGTLDETAAGMVDTTVDASTSDQ